MCHGKWAVIGSIYFLRIWYLTLWRLTVAIWVQLKHPVPDRVKPLFVIFDIGALWRSRSGWASECLDVKNCKWRLSPVWHRMLYSCTHVATVGVKGLNMICGPWAIDIQLDFTVANRCHMLEKMLYICVWHKLTHEVLYRQQVCKAGNTV